MYAGSERLLGVSDQVRLVKIPCHLEPLQLTPLILLSLQVRQWLSGKASDSQVADPGSNPAADFIPPSGL